MCAVSTLRDSSLDKGKSVVLALTGGIHDKIAIEEAVALAQTSSAIVIGLAVIDTKKLDNVGFVPVGGSYYAASLRNKLMERATEALEEVILFFEQTAQQAKVPYTILRQNGNPAEILKDFQHKDDVVVVDSLDWAGSDLSQQKTRSLALLNSKNLFPLFCRKNTLHGTGRDANGEI